jgi:hypothetical protein
MLVRTRRMRNFGIGAKLHKGSSNSNEDIEMSRDGSKLKMQVSKIMKMQ